MNKLTREILTLVLQMDQAWEPATKKKPERELRYSWVRDTLHGIREARFYDEIYFPRMMRAFRMIKAWNIFPGAEWDEVDMGYNEEIHGIWPRSPDLADCIGTHFCGEFWYTNTGKLRATYMAGWWDSEDWAWEDPSREEILALGIRPGLVPPKVDRQGNVQQSMF